VRKLARDGVASIWSITYAILYLSNDFTRFSTGKNYDVLWSAEVTDVLISTINVFVHCFWKKLGANYKRILFFCYATITSRLSISWFTRQVWLSGQNRALKINVELRPDSDP